jgi:hypothetical protein
MSGVYSAAAWGSIAAWGGTAAGASTIAAVGASAVGAGLNAALAPHMHLAVPPPPGAAMIDPAGSAAASAVRRRQAAAGGLNSTITGAGNAPAPSAPEAGPTSGSKSQLGQ